MPTQSSGPAHSMTESGSHSCPPSARVPEPHPTAANKEKEADMNFATNDTRTEASVNECRKPIASLPRCRTSAVTSALALLTSTLACNDGLSEFQASGGNFAQPDQQPASVAVTAQDVEVGFRRGVLRQRTSVQSFVISRYPITVGSYRDCVAAGVCTSPEWTEGDCSRSDLGVDGSTWERGHSEAPITCIGTGQAKRYCAWIGGRLPRPAEWLLAARGPAVQRFSWGDRLPSCRDHWRLAFSDVPGSCCGTDCAESSVVRAGLHPEHHDPFRIASVLVTRREMLEPDPNEDAIGCHRTAGACSVGGADPGAIDWFTAVVPPRGGSGSPVMGFRCVHEVE